MPLLVHSSVNVPFEESGKFILASVRMLASHTESARLDLSSQLCPSVTNPQSKEGCLMRALTDKSLRTQGCYLGRV